MTLAASYAKALRALIQEGKKSERELGESLKVALKRRGHEKLLPAIVHEYEKLEEGVRRKAEFSRVTPEREQKRILFELYKKLTAHHG